MAPTSQKPAANAAPSAADVQAYLFAQLETFFENVERIAGALEVIAQTQLTMAAIAARQLPRKGEPPLEVNSEGVLMRNHFATEADRLNLNWTLTPDGPILYADDEEASPETKPESEV